MTTSQTNPATRNHAARPVRPEHRLERLIQISRAIGSIHDERELMLAIMRHLTTAFSSERSTLYLHDPVRGELWTRVAQGLEHWPSELRIPDDAGLSGRVFQTQEPLCIADTFESPCFSRRLAEQTGYVPRSMLIVPVMRTGSQCIGVIQLLDRRVGYFREDDMPLMEAVAVQVGIALENVRLHEAQKRQFNSFVKALSTALDARDPLTALHSANVANYAMGIGEMLCLPPADVEWLRIAGLLHDVGKIGVPEAVLTKAGRLTPQEFAEMKQHAEYSRNILSQIEFTDALKDMARIAAAHHEKLDGSGYPDGLAGESIPLKARILAVADIYDALTQTRHYRIGMPMHEALAVIDGMTPGQLDANCVRALKAFLGVRA